MAWKISQQLKMDLNIMVFKTDFEKYFVEWNTLDITDDRILFCKMYNIGLEEYENMKKVKSNFINVAFNEKMEENIQTMHDIVDCFNSMGE